MRLPVKSYGEVGHSQLHYKIIRGSRNGSKSILPCSFEVAWMLQQQEHNSRPYSSKSSSHRCIGSLSPRLCSSKHFSPHSSSSFSHQATHRRRLEIQSRPEKGNNKYFPELFAIEIHWSTTAVENNFSNCELSRFAATNQHMAQEQDRDMTEEKLRS